MDDFIVNKDEDNFTFFGFADEDEESTYIGDDVHKATNTKPFQVDYISALLYIQSLTSHNSGINHHACMQAINDGKVDLLRELAAKSVPLETKSPFGHTPLEAACFKKNADAVESLIRSV